MKLIEEKKSKKTSAKGGKLNLIFSILAGIVLILGIIIGVYAYTTNKRIKAFKQFDIKELNSQDFIFQTIDFYKFIPYGTDEKRIFANQYNDEMTVYYVKGTASVSFNHLDRLEPLWESCIYDEENSILLLKYDTSKYPDESLFNVEVHIDSNDIQVPASIESRTLDIPLKEIDFVKPENPDVTIQRAKEDIKKEFERELFQPLEAKSKKNLCIENDTYAAFLNSLTELISNNSRWKNVEIVFE